ncbi:hypothetical protein GCM10027093_44650 [Paraburkholderia jirisanensis]
MNIGRHRGLRPAAAVSGLIKGYARKNMRETGQRGCYVIVFRDFVVRLRDDIVGNTTGLAKDDRLARHTRNDQCATRIAQ